MSDEDGLISRWSKRKRAAADEARASSHDPESEVLPENPDTEPAEPSSDETDEEILARFNLPDPDSLRPGDDFKGFMEAGVPEAIRRRALRKLWTSNPVLANLDGLNDYDEDFTSPEETAAVLKTAYKVGRGFLKDALDGDEEGRDPGTQDASLREPLDTSEAPARSQDEVSAISEEPAQSTQSARGAETDESPSRRPRRMRFDT